MFIRWDEKASLRRDAIGFQVIDVLEAQPAISDEKCDGNVATVTPGQCHSIATSTGAAMIRRR